MAHTLPLETQRQATPVVIASVSTDENFVGNLDVRKHLEALAGKLGLFDFEICYGDPQSRPGEQLSIPFPTRVARKPRR